MPYQKGNIVSIYELVAWSIDFEGAISIKKNIQRNGSCCYSPAIAIGGTSKRHLQRFRDRVGFGNVSDHEGMLSGKQSQWAWRIPIVEMRIHLPGIKEFLILKQQQALFVLECFPLLVQKNSSSIERNSERLGNLIHLEWLYTRCKELNEHKKPTRSQQEEFLRILRSR